MKQFGKILKFELRYYFKNKMFVAITLLLAVLIAGVMFFPRISDAIENAGSESVSEYEEGGEDTEAEVESGSIMLVKAPSPKESEVMAQFFSEAFFDYTVKADNGDIESIKQKITEGEVECAFIMTSPTAYTYYVNDLSMYDANEQIANEALQSLYRVNAMVSMGVPAEQAGEIMAVQIESSVETLGKNQMENYFYTYIMIMALYFVLLLYGQMVAMNVATEKSSRAMELLITSAKPTSMMFGKVIASCLAGFIQLISVFGTAVICYGINKTYWEDNMIMSSIFNIPVELLVYLIVFFILGFLIYAFLYGAIGSTASKLEDINTSVMPVTFAFLASFFVVVFSMASGSIDNTLIKVCSFIPLTSPMAMFTRIAMSEVPWYEIAASIAILVVSVVGVGYISAKIYRVGVLLYGTPPKMGAIIKAIRKAK